jgi:hypothetical protein
MVSPPLGEIGSWDVNLRTLKFSLAAILLMGASAGLAIPAMADQLTVTNVTVDSSMGLFYDVSLSGNNNFAANGMYYVGEVQFNGVDNSLGGQAFTSYVWCDDLFNQVYVGNSNYQYVTTNATGANAYLAPLGLTTIQEIAGLTFEGTLNSVNGASPAADAEIQTAIWELEYPTLSIQATSISDPNIQADVTVLENSALAYYGIMVADGFTYGEFESPNQGCTNVVGTNPYDDGCQTQGQIFVYPSPNGGGGQLVPPIGDVPEPGTLGLFGIALLALGGLGRRKISA